MPLSKPELPAVSRGRGAGSTRSSSHGFGPGGQNAEQANPVSFSDLGLDVVGEEGMEKELWVVIKGQRVTQQPDGRKCKLCCFRDNTWCPIGISVRGIKRYTLWGKPPYSDGRTQGSYCYKCIRYVTTHVARCSVAPITVAKYEETLSLDSSGQLVQQHCTVILLSVKKQIDSGEDFKEKDCDWAGIENEAAAQLDVVHSQKMRKRRPMGKFYRLAEYDAEFGSLETNGNKDKGHRYFELDNEKGVRVPGDGPTLLEEIEDLDARMTTKIGDSESHGGNSLRALQQSLFKSMVYEKSGGASSSIATVLQASSSKDDVDGNSGGLGNRFQSMFGSDGAASTTAGDSAMDSTPAKTLKRSRAAGGGSSDKGAP